MKRRFLSIFCILLMLASASAEVTPAPTLPSGELDLLAVDHKLYELGYRDSACTGEMTDVVIRALKNFQTVNGLEVTGEPDEGTVSLLMSGSGMSQADYLNRISMEYAQRELLSNGSYGDGVRELQQALKDLGYFAGECDGAYGRATEEAVYRFQMANGLKETGVADRSLYLRIYGGEPISWEDFLEESCASAGESGAHVRRIQMLLKNKNHFKGACTGRYGEGTQQAVKRFQTANDLEASGDVDMETCRLLFADMKAMRSDAEAIRRGEMGSEVAELHQALSSLGYPSSDAFNMQTELAVMQFQLVNEISITGIADATTLARIAHPSVRGMDSFDVEQHGVEIGENTLVQAARQAASVLGQAGMFESGFNFVSYVYLKCGQPLVAQEQLRVDMITDREAIEAGQIIFIEAGGEEICGIATADGAVIYADQTGYVVMRYLDMMNVESIFGCGTGADA